MSLVVKRRISLIILQRLTGYFTAFSMTKDLPHHTSLNHVIRNWPLPTDLVQRAEKEVRKVV